jgi:hypothetical protein
LLCGKVRVMLPIAVERDTRAPECLAARGYRVSVVFAPLVTSGAATTVVTRPVLAFSDKAGIMVLSPPAAVDLGESVFGPSLSPFSLVLADALAFRRGFPRRRPSGVERRGHGGESDAAYE